MANSYFNASSVPGTGAPGSSSTMRAEFAAVSAGFDKLPTLSGFGNKIVVVNSGGTALTTSGGSLSLTNDLTISGGFALTMTLTGATTVTLPTTGTLATIAGTETLTNKTVNLTSNTLTGTIAQFNTACSDADFATIAGSETLTNKTLTSPTINSPTINSPTLAGTPIFPDNVFTIGGSADATKKVAFEVDGLTTATTRTVTIPDASGTLAYQTGAFTTGDVKLTLKTTADATWVLMNDGTIGSASSGATTRANADTSDLYTLIWTNIIDQWAPVTGGRGASAAADFAANKPLALPKTLGRALAGYGVGVVSESGVDAGVDLTGDTFTVASNNTTWITGMPVVFTLTSGTITGLTSGNTYYIIRSSATLVQLASSLANAQNGTAINMTAKSSPVWTLTHTYTTRVLGETGGEIAHAMSLTELLAHTHTEDGAVSGTISGGGLQAAFGSIASGSKGGNVAMNIMQPTLFLNVMVKL